MDPIPQVPTSTSFNDTVSQIRDVFKEELEKEPFPVEVANNIRIHSVDDNLSLKETAKNTLEIQRFLEEESEIISGAEYEILQQHGDYVFHQVSSEKNAFLREMMRLKACDIFTNICLPDKLKYGLIEKCDLYPDVTRQFLDFRFNTALHQCHRCFSKLPNQPSDVCSPAKPSSTSKAVTKKPPPQLGLQLLPPQLVFRNFELNEAYELPFHIRNVSSRVEKVGLGASPQLRETFQLVFQACQRLAPGMSLKGAVRFTPSDFASLEDRACFLSGRGDSLRLSIQCRRDPPKLLAFVFKSGSSRIRLPGSSSFSTRRQHAVNNTIDCGSCFSSEHVLVSLVLANHGNKARFFWLTEEEFCGQDVQTVSSGPLELKADCFWIYPTFFEMLPGEMCEISILFQPIQGGFQGQSMFLMCDNNTYRQIDLIGDAITFNRNIVSVGIPHQARELEKKKNHCIFLGHISHRIKGQFTLSITNCSSMFLKYFLVFGLEKMGVWMRISNEPPHFLAPYSSTVIAFDCACPADVPSDYYSTPLRLFICDVPIASLENEERFLISTQGRALEDVVRKLYAVDVLVMEVEVACFVDLPAEHPSGPLPIQCKNCGNLDCPCQTCHETVPMADLVFDRTFLDFGILPIGVDVSKEFSIKNLGEKELPWHIVEMEYHLDGPPYVQVLAEPQLSSQQGLLHPGKELKLNYNLLRKPLGRNVALLVLFSFLQSPESPVAQSICVVTYEVAALNIQIKTGQSQEAILCPMRMLYTGVPVDIGFKIHNSSPIPGVFCFLKPLGADAHKVEVVYSPQSGELKAGSTRRICLKLTCFEVGILEEVILPCFIGKDQKPLELRLLCLVDCVHVFFYLPGKAGEFQKVLWPPKVVYEYERSWSSCCFCEEDEEDNEKPLEEHEVLVEKVSNDTLNLMKSERSSQSLLKTLLRADSDIFLQECVVEVRQVATNQPTKVRIFLENVTPKSAKYCVQASNYPAKRERLAKPYNVWSTRPDDHWTPLIQRNGLLVQPQPETSSIGSHQLVAVDLWIYANTWGVYSEEVVVDIEDIVPFSFSLLVEVVGSPLMMPSALGALTRYPTVRFGAVSSGSEDLTRHVLIRNTSAIEATVAWHVFVPKEGDESAPFNLVCDAASEEFQLSLTEQYLGEQASESLEVEGRMEIGSGAQLLLPVVLKPRSASPPPEELPLRWLLLGRIFPKEADRLQPGYLLRKPVSWIVEVTATLVKPQLQVELLSEAPMRVYANEVALSRRTHFAFKCLLRNPTLAGIQVDLECSEPLSLGSTGRRLLIGPQQCQEIELECVLSYEKVLKWAAHVYRLTDMKEPIHSRGSMEMAGPKFQPGEEKNEVEDEHKVLTLHRKLSMYFQGGDRHVIPINVMIYYPHIAVKPVHVKFGYVLLERTQKTVVTIFNLTGYVVLFEVYKTIASQEIFVTPSSGQIAKSVGQNHSCTNVNIYFTPTECRTYHESIRIVTNIPQCHIDVPIKGAGSFNEKFA